MKPATEPTQLPHLPRPGENSQITLARFDWRVVEVSGVLQCTAIFIHNTATGARYAAHFGGWANHRRPNADDMRAMVQQVIFGAGGPILGQHRNGISVTICKNSSSPQHSLPEADGVLRNVIPGGIPIVHAQAPGERFFFTGTGAVFGSPA